MKHLHLYGLCFWFSLWFVRVSNSKRRFNWMKRWKIQMKFNEISNENDAIAWLTLCRTRVALIVTLSIPLFTIHGSQVSISICNVSCHWSVTLLFLIGKFQNGSYCMNGLIQIVLFIFGTFGREKMRAKIINSKIN